MGKEMTCLKTTVVVILNQPMIIPMIVGDVEITLVEDKAASTSVVRLCNELANQETKHIFPGPMAVSIERANFGQLKQNFYWVCEKSDGSRYILFSTMMQWGGQLRKMCFMINRSLEVYIIKVCFPVEVYRGTVLDGELIQQFDGSWIFLVFDAMCIDGLRIADQCHSTRISRVKGMLEYYKPELSNLHIQVKHFVPFQSFKQYTTEMMPTNYKNDGFVLTPENAKLEPGRCSKLFKLKPSDQHTVDFLVNSQGHACVWDDTKYKKVTNLLLPQEIKDVLVQKKGAIVECVWDGKVWSPLKIRTDKVRPNNKYTLDKTMLNFSENIQLRELF